jgi:uncharacterized membrane protein YsdA (DUF1294 family)/cold shock CspA family protein
MGESLRGKIIEWNDVKGFGFVDDGRRRIFLHRRDFRQLHKRPEKGDLIHFTVGADQQGRVCARDAHHNNDGGRLSFLGLTCLAVLLIAPSFAAHDWLGQEGALWLLGACGVVSLLTYFVYASDKDRAQAKTWRVAESTLHFCELVGGWPGAFIAQRRLRHKVSKPGYQFVFWTIVLVYQYVAADRLLKWRMTSTAAEFIQAQL